MDRRLRPTSIRMMIALVGMLSIALLTGCGVNLPALKPPSASDLLAKVKHPGWKDATFTITDKISSQSPLVGVSSIAITGAGKLTTNPARSDIVYKDTVTSSAAPSGIPMSGEIISDGASLYTKSAGQSKWLKFDGCSTTSTSGSQANVLCGNIAAVGDIKNVQFVGADTINGVATWHIKGDTAGSATGAGAQGTGTGTIDVWVRQNNFYPVKIVNHTIASSNGVNATIDQTVLFTAWDTGVTITVPSADQVQSI